MDFQGLAGLAGDTATWTLDPSSKPLKYHRSVSINTLGLLKHDDEATGCIEQ